MTRKNEGKAETFTKENKLNNVIIKRNDSIFYNTSLLGKLNITDVDTLIFCGIDTSICVESSIRDGFNLGFDIVVISDATASLNDETYHGTLHDI